MASEISVYHAAANPAPAVPLVLPQWKKHGITIGSTMKTAVSIDDGLLRQVDETARLMGLSRSRLFTLAVGDFLNRQRQDQMLHQLNEVYANEPGEKVLLKIVARHADMWNVPNASAERYAALLKVIERHGDTVGRDTDQIEKTIMMGLTYRAPAEREKAALDRITAISGSTPEQARRQMMIGSREECLETIDRYLKVGVTHFIFTLPRPFYLDEVQRFAEEVIPAVRSK